MYYEGLNVGLRGRKGVPVQGGRFLLQTYTEDEEERK